MLRLWTTGLLVALALLSATAWRITAAAPAPVAPAPRLPVEHYCSGCPSPFLTPWLTATPPVPRRAPATPLACLPEGMRVPSPDGPGGRWSELEGIGGTGPNDLWAVGYYDALSVVTLILHWDGATWSVVPAPHVGILYAVKAFSPKDAWAVGWGMAHWDGTAWTEVQYPGGRLYNVDGVAPNDVWAVGDNVEHWNGAVWQVVPHPPIGDLHGLAVVAANDAWTVGSYCKTGAPCATLIEHWNGAAWRIVPSPNVGPGNNYLRAVAAFAADDVWATGDGGNGTVLVEHWDGAAWSIAPSPPFSGGIWNLAVPAAHDLWAPVGRAQVAHGDGTAWVSSSPVPETRAVLNGIFALTPGDIWAVGSVGEHYPDTLVERFAPAGPTCVPPPTNTVTPTPSPSATSTPTPALWGGT